MQSNTDHYSPAIRQISQFRQPPAISVSRDNAEQNRSLVLSDKADQSIKSASSDNAEQVLISVSSVRAEQPHSAVSVVGQEQNYQTSYPENQFLIDADIPEIDRPSRLGGDWPTSVYTSDRLEVLYSHM